MQNLISKLLNSRWPAVLWTLLIFILLTMQLGSLEKVPMLGIRNLDKPVHAILFGMLVFLWWRYIYASNSKPPATNIILLLFFIASAYGIGMEFYQKYFTSREFEIGDIYADTIGAAVSAFICSYKKN